MKVTVELNGFDEIDEAATLLAAMRDGWEAAGRLRAEPAVAADFNGHAEPETIPDPRQLELPLEEPIDAARERLRGLAKEKGVVWLRSVLEAAGVQRLGDLPETAVRDLLRAQ
jgi:hypothetical protein